MRVLGVDTAAEPRSRGYALAEAGRLIWASKTPPDGAWQYPPTVVAGERPWGGNKLRGQALITFCVNNGFQLRDAWGYSPVTFVLLPVRDWKNLVLPGCAGMPGDVFCANFRQRYAPSETDTDILDAMGIALAVSKLTAKQLKKYIPKGFTR